jgi:hypothetical protein
MHACTHSARDRRKSEPRSFDLKLSPRDHATRRSLMVFRCCLARGLSEVNGLFDSFSSGGNRVEDATVATETFPSDCTQGFINAVHCEEIEINIYAITENGLQCCQVPFRRR